MNDITIIKRCLKDENYLQAISDAVAYLKADGNGLIGLAEIATEVKKAKDNE